MNHNKLICYQKALGLTKTVPALIAKWPLGHAYLIDQLKRAASSIVLNIAEGNSRCFPKERARFFNIARASASEVSSIIDVAFALDLIDKACHEHYQSELVQISKILFRLCQIAFNESQ